MEYGNMFYYNDINLGIYLQTEFVIERYFINKFNI